MKSLMPQSSRRLDWGISDFIVMDFRNDPNFFHLLDSSYRHLLQQPLVPTAIPDAEAPRWLYEDAPFAVLAHNTEPDPIFVYGNRTAQKCFEYTWEELILLPSRLSAEASERGERQRFMERVARDGFVTGYCGIRITKSGRRFWIEDATVWDLTDADGTYRGQAAMIPLVVDVQS